MARFPVPEASAQRRIVGAATTILSHPIRRSRSYSLSRRRILTRPCAIRAAAFDCQSRRACPMGPPAMRRQPLFDCVQLLDDDCPCLALR